MGDAALFVRDMPQKHPHPWRELPWGRIVRWIAPEPKWGATRTAGVMIAIGVTNPRLEPKMAQDGATRLHVLDRLTSSSSSVLARHCSSKTRPCWCWPDEEETYVGSDLYLTSEGSEE